ncbi:MAG: carbohydrate-binding domain-containing protein [Chlorobiales bacterium]|nr:carbohydrate-binding domain-containing protein [Chlorobiales bacterium]
MESCHTVKPKLPIIVILVFSLTLAIAGCKDDDSSVSNQNSTSSDATTTIDSTSASGTAEGSTETAYDADDLIENSTFSKTVTIAFGNTLTISNPLESSGVTIAQDGNDLTITSTVKEVEYILSGTTSKGSFKIYSSNKFKLTLNGVSITNPDGSAINIQSGKRAFVVLANGSSNSLTDGSTYDAAPNDEDMKATLFSEGQLIFSGSGSLIVKGNYKHAICSDDYVRIREGNITISGAVTDGIHTKEAFISDGGTLKITAASDGIECEEGFVVVNAGNMTMNVGDDGIAASYKGTDTSIDPYLTINNGTIKVTSSAGEGIESKSVLTINNGYIMTTTADDGLNAGTAIYINGGSVYSYSSSNDAMDSNGTFTITGGKVVAVGAWVPECGIDCDKNSFKITGGILVSIGGATSEPSASASTQCSVILGNGSLNQIIHIQAVDKTEALTFLAPKPYNTMLFAGSKLKSNTTYNVYAGGSVSGGTAFNGLYTSGSYMTGAKLQSFTTTNMVTKVGGAISPH